LIITFTEH